MTVDELLAAYPNADQIVGWCELVFFGVNEGEGVSCYDIVREQRPEIDPVQMRDVVRTVFDRTDTFDAKLPKAAAQIDHPEFLTYLAGKMGAL